MTDLSEEILEDVRVVAVDFETTGLDPLQGEEICEVGLAFIKGGKIEKTHDSLVKITKPMPYDAYVVHGISDENLKDAPDLESILGEFVSITEGCVYIAHNRDFDLSFLNVSLAKLGYKEIKTPFLDLLEIARKILPGLENHKLGTIADALKVEKMDLHRALGDAIITARVFIAMVDIFALWGKTVAHFEELSEHPRRSDINPLILTALNRHSRIRIYYESANGSISERIVRPISVTDDNRMLVSFCYLAEDRRHFRIDRIVDVEEIE